MDFNTGKTYIIFMNKGRAAVEMIALCGIFLLADCALESSNAESWARPCDVDTQIPWGRRPVKWAVSTDGYAYILDHFSGISRWKRMELPCRWELDRQFGQDGLESQAGFADDVRWDSGELWLRSGNEVRTLAGDKVCRTGYSGAFAVSREYVVAAEAFGAGVYRWNGRSCSPETVVGTSTLQAVATDGELIVSGEIFAGGLSVRAHQRSGALVWMFARDAEGTLCSVSRLVLDAWSVFVLDTACARVGVLSRNGQWAGFIALKDAGIRGHVIDMATTDPGWLWILTDSSPMIYRVSYNFLAGNL